MYITAYVYIFMYMYLYVEMIKMTSIATIIYHATVLLMWSWRTATG